MLKRVARQWPVGVSKWSEIVVRQKLVVKVGNKWMSNAIYQ